MLPITLAYGRKAFEEWERSGRTSTDLSDVKSSPAEAASTPWRVDTFAQLVSAVAFLTVMNKRDVLLYRGQAADHPPLPVLFREHWSPFDAGRALFISAIARERYYNRLATIGNMLYDFSRTNFGLPRWRGMRDTPAIQWAVAQHYGVWPTPLLDLTSSLRVAASFAFRLRASAAGEERSAFLFVFAFPVMGDSEGPILTSQKHQLVLARLQACCPPAAIRAHLQDGYLAGDLSLLEFASHRSRNSNSMPQGLGERSNLQCRLIAKMHLHDHGNFWSQAHPVLSEDSLLPAKDPFALAVRAHLQDQIERLAEESSNAV